jgi:hypothetical protein
MKLPFTNSQLMKIAATGGVFVLGNALLMKWLVQKRLRQSPYFEQARDTLMGNRSLVDLLGEPVGFGSVDLDNNTKNYSTTTEAKFEVPLKGSKTEGTMFLDAVRKNQETLGTDGSNIDLSPTNRYMGWKLTNLEVTITDRPNQKVVLVREPSHVSQGS